MPSLIYPDAPRYVPAPKTQVELEYADLAIVDLAKADTPEGRAELAVIVREAMTTIGFFYAINHGYNQAQTDRIFDIANVPFDGVSAEEKLPHVANIEEAGSFQGYKLRQYWHIDGGVLDQMEHYSINRDVTKRTHPKPFGPFLPEVEAFARHNHYNVLHPLLGLFARGLELPEETLVDIHGFDAVGETYSRFMKYYPRTKEEEQKSKNVWLKGHTDLGSVTVLWSQPIAALQILSPDGKWRWIKHIDNALVINAGDMLEFLSGSFYKATIHRVVQPPSDQQNYPRLGVFYFTMPDDNVKLVPCTESPVLQRVGIHRRFDDDQAPTTEVWRRGRTIAYGRTNLKQKDARSRRNLLTALL